MTPAARIVRDIHADPPRGGWNRRNFLRTLTALGALLLFTETPAFAQAQRSAGRIKVSDIKIQRLRLEKDWGTYEDYVGARRGGRTGGGAITEIYTDQGLIGIGPGIAEGALSTLKQYLVG